jgi:hypothetical protein
VFAEGAIMAIEHPGIAAGSTAIAGIVLFKSKYHLLKVISLVAYFLFVTFTKEYLLL